LALPLPMALPLLMLLLPSWSGLGFLNGLIRLRDLRESTERSHHVWMDGQESHDAVFCSKAQ
jgi:hypothetical protein